MRHEAKATLPEGGKARRVYLLLRDEISQGVHNATGLLPGEQRLAEVFGVSRVTVRRALEALSRDGLVVRRAGSGTLIVPHARKAPPIAADFATLMPQLVDMEQTTTARLLSFAYGPPPVSVADAMGLDPKDRVQTAVRVRLARDAAFSHLTTYVPEDIAIHYSEGDLATTPLFRLLERGGVTIAGADQSVTAALAAPDVADALGVSTGSPLLSLQRVVRDAAGRAVEYLSALYRPDLFRLQMSLTRVGEGAARHWEPVIGATREDDGI